MMKSRFDSPPIIMHYASPYYDPVKAKEYYERTKVLKGRTKKMTESQRSAWEYTRQNIRNDRTKKLDNSRAAGQAQIGALRQNATQKRELIRSSLQKLVDEYKSKKIPKDAPPEVKEKLKMERAAAREKIRGISSDLKSMIASVRSHMKTERETINSDFKKIEERELKNIKEKTK